MATDVGKKLAIFSLLCAGGMLIVGLMSLVALMMSVLSYQRLALLVEKSEGGEVSEEEGKNS